MAQLPAPRISACAGVSRHQAWGPWGPRQADPPSSLATCGPAGGGAFSLAAFFGRLLLLWRLLLSRLLAPEALSWLVSVERALPSPALAHQCRTAAAKIPASSRCSRQRPRDQSAAVMAAAPRRRSIWRAPSLCLDPDRREVAGAPSSFALHEHLNMPALRVHKMAPASACDALLAQARGAARDHRAVELAHARGRRARPRREWKHMQEGEPAIVDQRQRVRRTSPRSRWGSRR